MSKNTIVSALKKATVFAAAASTLGHHFQNLGEPDFCAVSINCTLNKSVFWEAGVGIHTKTIKRLPLVSGTR